MTATVTDLRPNNAFALGPPSRVSGWIWTDGQSLLIQLVTKPNQPPCIQKYGMHELWKALSIIREHRYDYATAPVSGPWNPRPWTTDDTLFASALGEGSRTARKRR